MEHLRLFHRDILTVRSHQWKYYVEPYSGCALQCTYCLYWESPAFVQRLHPPSDLVPGFERDLEAMSKKQIVYIGATIDPYQMLEKKLRVTRQLLERLARRRIPVVILTKSPLILDDLDVLRDLSRDGLALVQFTVLTTNERKARTIERAAPAVSDRLRAASQLAAAGVPVHFHLSPVIPGLYEPGELHATVRAIADAGGQCIYSNILGMRHLNLQVWLDSMAQLPGAVASKTRAAYMRAGDAAHNVYSPEIDTIHDEMSALRDVCRDSQVDFICEFIPGLDSFDPARFAQGIFRFGLPTVYQMADLFESRTPVSWRDFRDALVRLFPALDDEYTALVGQYWDDGQLFENTTIHPLDTPGGRMYLRTNRLNLARDTVMAWD